MNAPEQMGAIARAVRYELAPMIRAAEMLAEFERVHRDLHFSATHDKGFDESLASACPTWANPGATDDGGGLCELLRVAVEACLRIADEADEALGRRDSSHAAPSPDENRCGKCGSAESQQRRGLTVVL